jgi:hypothetical protein
MMQILQEVTMWVRQFYIWKSLEKHPDDASGYPLGIDGCVPIISKRGQLIEPYAEWFPLQ